MNIIWSIIINVGNHRTGNIIQATPVKLTCQITDVGESLRTLSRHHKMPYSVSLSMRTLFTTILGQISG